MIHKARNITVLCCGSPTPQPDTTWGPLGRGKLIGEAAIRLACRQAHRGFSPLVVDVDEATLGQVALGSRGD